MGFGFPAAIGAAMATGKATWCVVGDGGFQMTLCELATAALQKTPVKILIINNSYLGMIRQWQELFFDNRISGADLEGTPDFIKRHIFPGSCIPSVAALTEAVAHTDLRLVHFEDITPHYAETLRRWRETFEAAWPRIRALGYDERFRRLWRFYLCYCEGGFAEAVLGSVQMVLAKPHAELPASLAVPVAAARTPALERAG